MAMTIHRTVTALDESRLDNRASTFATRHHLDRDAIARLGRKRFYEGLCHYVDNLEQCGDPRLARLWGKVVARVAGHPRATDIAYGMFGWGC